MLFDEVKLFQPAHIFQLLFSDDGRPVFFTQFIKDELMQTVPCRETTGAQVIFMFVDPAQEIICNTDVYCRPVIGHDIDRETFPHDLKPDSGQAGMTATKEQTAKN
jgi:hypothetical protein